jgi:hypothetical protein
LGHPATEPRNQTPLDTFGLLHPISVDITERSANLRFRMGRPLPPDRNVVIAPIHLSCWVGDDVVVVNMLSR